MQLKNGHLECIKYYDKILFKNSYDYDDELYKFAEKYGNIEYIMSRALVLKGRKKTYKGYIFTYS
jgi:hypothetical protein